MSSLEEKRKLKTSIRPNGKIRPIPKHAQAQISLNDIQPGNEMANFHDEYLYDRFYKAEDVEQLLKTTAQNPFTREPLREVNVQSYYASINGNIGERSILNIPNVSEEYSQVLVTFLQSGSNKEIHFQPYLGERITNPEQQILVEKTTPLAEVLGKFMETSFDSYWYKPEDKYLKLFGIRDLDNSYLLAPEYRIYKNSTILIRDYSAPVSTYVSPTSNHTLTLKDEILDSLDLFQVGTPNLQRTPIFEGVYAGFWIGIKSDIKYKTKDEFIRWLFAHPADYEEYKKGIFTENTIQKGAELREYAEKFVYEKFTERMALLGRRRWGGKRKTRRLTKRSRRYRKYPTK